MSPGFHPQQPSMCQAMLRKCLVSAFVYLVLFCPVFISLLLPHDLYTIKVLMKVGLKIYRLAFKHCLEIHGKAVYSLVSELPPGLR